MLDRIGRSAWTRRCQMAWRSGRCRKGTGAWMAALCIYRPSLARIQIEQSTPRHVLSCCRQPVSGDTPTRYIVGIQGVWHKAGQEWRGGSRVYGACRSPSQGATSTNSMASLHHHLHIPSSPQALPRASPTVPSSHPLPATLHCTSSSLHRRSSPRQAHRYARCLPQPVARLGPFL